MSKRCWLTGAMRTLVFILVLRGYCNALQVIGGNQTVVLGQTTILPCKLIESTEVLSQITWKRKTRRYPQIDNFFSIQAKNGPQFFNGYHHQFQFIGNFAENNGALQLSNATLLDEGVYTCVFTLFPSGNYKAEITLAVQVPPVIHVKDERPRLADEEVSLATCTAAGSKPPAEVRWNTNSLSKLRTNTSMTQHENGTTTTISTLVGVPTKDVYKRQAECIVTTSALPEEKIVPFTIQVYFSPMEVKITSSNGVLGCEADANPNAQFTWKRPGQPWPHSGVSIEGEKLNFQSISSHMKGLYQCEATNQYGTGHAYLTVHIQSEACIVCWILLGLLLFLIVIGVAFLIYLYQSGNLERILMMIPEKKQKTFNAVTVVAADEDIVLEEHGT